MILRKKDTVEQDTVKNDMITVVIDPELTTIRLEDQPDALSKAVVYGAQLLEENDRLTKEIAELEKQYEREIYLSASNGEKHREQARELAYWKRHGRRFWGRWHVSVQVDLTPWSWAWKPQYPNRLAVKVGAVQFAWLFLRIDAFSD